MGSGGALVDYDKDGDLDIYLVQSGSLESGEGAENRLYRNGLLPDAGSGTPPFEDVTAGAGVGHRGYGMGVATGDFNNDGFLDLFVTNFGRNALYRNEGDGTFDEVGSAAGVDDDRWGTSAAFLDFDLDGYLDLFVVNYVDFRVSENPVCRPTGERDYCHPRNFDPQVDILYRNRGDGTFADVTSAAGIERAYGSGLGVAVMDFDGDGWLDLYVANDGNENQLWRNRGNGTFEDVALFAGVALNGDGAAEAGMGIAVDDFDRDGDPDIFVTHLRDETNTLYENQGNGLFEDTTFPRGLGYPSLAATAFGVGWLDFDNDGFSDLFVANGSVALGLPERSGVSRYAEPNQLFRGDGGRFEAVSMGSGPAAGLIEVSRGTAFGDVDGDGGVDVLISNNDGPAQLLLNQVGAGRRWIALKLKRIRGETLGYGAQVTLVRQRGERVRKLVGSDGSYASASDPRIHFGLDADTEVSGVEVTWPGGVTEFFGDVAVDRENELVEGTGSRG
ncbi:MAG: CRTAC1 family protein [Gemmatimonadetes bacterium]|nr:CRTAC1 family protein [Gemmatimonadota bacterium]